MAGRRNRATSANADPAPTPPSTPPDQPAPEPAYDPSLLAEDAVAAEQAESRRALRRYRKSEDEAAAPEKDATESEILLLSSLLRRLVEKKLSTSDEPEETARPKNNRFVSRAFVPSNATPGAEPPPAPALAPPSMKLKPRTEQGAITKDHWQQSSLTPGKWLGYLGLILAFGAVAYLVGRSIVGPAVAPVHVVRGRQDVTTPGLTRTWPATMVSQLDTALAADQSGDLDTALAIATELKRRMPDAPGIDLYLARLRARQGELKETETAVVKQMDAFTPPLEAAAVNENLGFIYARNRDLPRAASSFAAAAATDPFNPDHFRNWGETLRRQGQLQEAVDRFRQALARLPVGLPEAAGARAEVEYKLDLTQIEAGKDEDVKAAVDEHLKERTPSGYWQLTAAAYALQHGDMTTAAGALARARATFPAEIYAALTHDYFFHNFSSRKEVAALLPADTPGARVQPFQSEMGYFLDP